MSPLFFGVAHFHHMVERIRKGEPVLTSFLISMFQVGFLPPHPELIIQRLLSAVHLHHNLWDVLGSVVHPHRLDSLLKPNLFVKSTKIFEIIIHTIRIFICNVHLHRSFCGSLPRPRLLQLHGFSGFCRGLSICYGMRFVDIPTLDIMLFSGG